MTKTKDSDVLPKDLYRCELCHVTIRKVSKYSHLKCKKHKRNIENQEEVAETEAALELKLEKRIRKKHGAPSSRPDTTHERRLDRSATDRTEHSPRE